MTSKKSNILSKLNLLNIRNKWSMAIIEELSNRRGASACIEPLFKDTKKRMKANGKSDARQKFRIQLKRLKTLGLIYEKTTKTGLRIYIESSIWQLEDAKINSIEHATFESIQNRKINIKWETILKKVRKKLTSYHVEVPLKVSKTLVRYFLFKKHQWKNNDDGVLVAAKKSISKKAISPEDQPDLFG